jgi:hypothetical protein
LEIKILKIRVKERIKENYTSQKKKLRKLKNIFINKKRK